MIRARLVDDTCKLRLKLCVNIEGRQAGPQALRARFVSSADDGAQMTVVAQETAALKPTLFQVRQLSAAPCLEPSACSAWCGPAKAQSTLVGGQQRPAKPDRACRHLMLALGARGALLSIFRQQRLLSCGGAVQSHQPAWQP